MGHHEVAPGQHEIDFHFNDALRAADSLVTLKYTIRALAANNGLIATFMPKPIFGINGSGMHTHQSIFDDEGHSPPPVNEIKIYELDEVGLAKLGISQLPGSLEEALEELAADPILAGALGVDAYEVFVRAKRGRIR